MSLANFMIHVFCFIDDYLAARTAEEPFRQRGPTPTQANSEVLDASGILIVQFFGKRKLSAPGREGWRALPTIV